MACKYRKPEAGVAGWIMSWRNCGKQGNAILRTYVQYYYSVTMLRARHTADLNDERNFVDVRCACGTLTMRQGVARAVQEASRRVKFPKMESAILIS